MLTLYDLKPRFQALLRPLTGELARRGVTANQITLAAALLSLAIGAGVVFWPTERWSLLLVPVALFLRMALNAIDGMLAREYGMKTPLGGLLNELGDVFSDVFLYLPFALVDHSASVWVRIAFILLSGMAAVTIIQRARSALREID